MIKITLTKPAIDYTSQERAEIYSSLYRSLFSDLAAKNNNKLNGQQVAWVKGRAWQAMRKAGF